MPITYENVTRDEAAQAKDELDQTIEDLQDHDGVHVRSTRGHSLVFTPDGGITPRVMGSMGEQVAGDHQGAVSKNEMEELLDQHSPGWRTRNF